MTTPPFFATESASLGASEPADGDFINPWRMFFGAMAPNWLLMRPEVSAGAKLCYAILTQFAGENGECYPRQNLIAERLGCSARQVREYLRELESLSLVWTKHRGLNRSNTYRFRRHPWMTSYRQPGDAGASETASAGQDVSHLERKACSLPDRKSSSGQDRQDPSAQVRKSSSVPIGEEIQKEEIQGKKNTPTGHGLSPVPPSLDAVLAFASVQGIPDVVARKYHLDRESVGWMKRGQPIRNWQSDVRAYLSTWRATEMGGMSRTQRLQPARDGAFAQIPGAGAYTSTKI